MATITYNTELAETVAKLGNVPARKAPCTPEFVADKVSASYAELATLPRLAYALRAKHSNADSDFVLVA